MARASSGVRGASARGRCGGRFASSSQHVQYYRSIYLSIYLYIYIYICILVLQIYIYIYIYIWIDTYIYIYTHIHTHLYNIYIYIYIIVYHMIAAPHAALRERVGRPEEQAFYNIA